MTTQLEIITNNHERLLLNWHELTPNEQKEYDWIDDPKNAGETFFRYRNWCYCFSEFMRIENNDDLKGWDGYSSDSYFSGVLIKITDDCDGVIVGRYYS